MWVVVFFVAFNATGGLLVASGTADYMGLNPDVSGGQEIDDATANAQDYGTGSPGGSTLSGFYNALASPLEATFNLIFPGFAMLKAFVPNYIVNFGATALALIPGYDIAMYLRSG
jgi:hypothetical protein